MPRYRALRIHQSAIFLLEMACILVYKGCKMMCKNIKVAVDSISKQASKTPTRPATRDTSAATPKHPEPTATGSSIWDLTSEGTVPDKPVLYSNALCIPVMHTPAGQHYTESSQVPNVLCQAAYTRQPAPSPRSPSTLLDNQHPLLDHYLQLLRQPVPSPRPPSTTTWQPLPSRPPSVRGSPSTISC